MTIQISALKSRSRYLAIFLLLISVLFITPKELLHELTCHKDTADIHATPQAGLVFSEIHHHCDILQALLQPYNSTDASVDFLSPAKIISHYSFIVISFSAEVVQRFVIRGPPAEIFSC